MIQRRKNLRFPLAAELGGSLVDLAHSTCADRGTNLIMRERADDQITPREPSIVSCGVALKQGRSYSTSKAFRNCAPIRVW